MTERLDRIEAILERTAQKQEQFDARLDRLTQEREESQRNFDARIEQLFQAFERSREEIDLLGERIGQIAASVSELKQDREDTWAGLNRFMGVMVQFQEQAAADRAVMLENQTEIRRIWEYLLRQHPNGHGGNQP
jgi:chromosome segregation ATPase